MPPPFLPVITVVTLDDGTQLAPADELRISTGLEAEAVEEDGRTRIVLTAVAVTPEPSGLGLPFSVAQENIDALDSSEGYRTVLAFAPDTGVHIDNVRFMSSFGAIASDTDYVEVTLAEYGPEGTVIRSFGSFSNTDFYSWTQLTVARSINVNMDLPAGHTLVAYIEQHGLGTRFGGVWVLT